MCEIKGFKWGDKNLLKEMMNALEQLVRESLHHLYNKECPLNLLKKIQKSGKNYNINFYNAQKLWGILVFEMWRKMFIEGEKVKKL